MIEWFWKTWKEVVLSPARFFSGHSKENWQEEPLSFFLIASWIFALGATSLVFINKLWPIGITLVEEINLWQRLLVLPVIVAVCLVFFGMILTIAAGFTVAGLFVMLLVLSFVLRWAVKLFKQGVSWEALLTPLLYSTAALLFTLAVFLLAVLTRLLNLPQIIFIVGLNLVYLAVVFYLVWSWALAVEKEAALPFKKALCLSLIIGFLFIVFQIAFNFKIIDKVANWMI